MFIIRLDLLTTEHCLKVSKTQKIFNPVSVLGGGSGERSTGYILTNTHNELFPPPSFEELSISWGRD